MVMADQTGQWPYFGFSIPHYIMPSAIPITLVCGPPGAGKSTVVREGAGPADIVVDFDTYLKAAGGVKWDTDKTKVRAAFAARDAALRGLAERTGGMAWVIACAPTRAERAAWTAALKNVSVIMLDVPPDVCKERIREDSDRLHAVEKMCAAVDDWWRNYEPDNSV